MGPHVVGGQMLDGCMDAGETSFAQNYLLCYLYVGKEYAKAGG